MTAEEDLARLDAYPNVTISATGSFLDAERGDEQ